MRKLIDSPVDFSQTFFFFNNLNKSNLVFPPLSCPTFSGISTEKSSLSKSCLFCIQAHVRLKSRAMSGFFRLV